MIRQKRAAKLEDQLKALSQAGLTKLPSGLHALALARMAALLCGLIKSTLKWTPIIASVLFGAGLLVAVATPNLSPMKTFRRLIGGYLLKEPSSMQEVLPPLEPPF